MKIEAGRKYKTRNGFEVEIDCVDLTADATDRSCIFTDHVVLGRILMTGGWSQCQWKSDGRFGSDPSNGTLDLVDDGPDPRTVPVEIHQAIAINEINDLLDYVTVNGIDPELFTKHDREGLQTSSARVVFDLIVESHCRSVATTED